jgi:MSHA biogenesis protein MshL
MKAGVGACLAATLFGLGLAGCATQPPSDTRERIGAELATAAQPPAAKPPEKSAAPPIEVQDALLPPVKGKSAPAAEHRFDLLVSGAPAGQVFMGIVTGTPYSMLVHPDVTGTVSVNLKNATVREALDALRELYGYEYKIAGKRIFIESPALRTEVFQVNYLSGTRKGTSDIRVISGSVSNSPSGTSGSTSGATTTSSSSSQSLQTSTVSTTTHSDFWQELRAALAAIVGTQDGRSVVLSPQSGVILVRAGPQELRQVADFLKAAQLSISRQVMLEAKIIEVQLNDGHQTGINWAILKNDGTKHSFSVGADTSQFLVPGQAVDPAATLAATLGAGIAGATGTTAGLFSMAFQSGNFAALLNFLDSQGSVHVLSSPRIATLNNQKAVLKVGTDDFFVTDISTTTTTGTATTTTPDVTLQPFFSGIALDVTPQIDANDGITLHIHPTVSNVTEKTKSITAGTGTLSLPLASSSVSETDSIVRVSDGQIVAIGGLMSQSSSDTKNQVTGLGTIPIVGSLFRNTAQTIAKRELVILLKTTVIHDASDWARQAEDDRARIDTLAHEKVKYKP